MFSHLAILIFGIILGYIVAYFHYSVDPRAFNAEGAAVSSTQQSKPAAAIRPAGIDSLEKELNAYVSAKDWENVISLGEAGLKIQPEFRDALSPMIGNAYRQRAKTLFENGRYEQSLKYLTQAKGYISLSATDLIMVANNQLKLGAYAKAKKALSQADGQNTLAPQKITSLQRKIVAAELDAALKKNDLDQAVHVLELELIGDASHSAYHVKLGELHFKMRNYDKAAESLENAIQLGEDLSNGQQDLLRKAKRRASFPDAVEVPIEAQGSSIFVNVSINDTPALRFVMDTGATYTTISRSSAESLGLSLDAGNTVSISTANGIVPAIRTSAESVAVASAKLEEVEIIVLDEIPPGMDGLLGLSFLSHFNVELASQEGLLILKPR